MVAFDIPLVGDINGLDVVHLQCHIGTDTLSLIRRGAKSAVGLDFSPASLKAARELAESAHGGEHVRFVEASVYDAGVVLEPETFDLVFTGIGALCWLPDIRKWAQTVASLLKPGGRLFIREGHPMLWTLDDEVTDKLVVGSTYFEEVEASVYENPGTYVKRESTTEFKYTKSMEWNHGLGEIVQAVLDAGMAVTGLVEHRSIPWNALHGQMVELENGELTSIDSRCAY